MLLINFKMLQGKTEKAKAIIGHYTLDHLKRVAITTIQSLNFTEHI